MLGRARSLLQLAASWRTISPTCAHSGPAERRAASSPPFASAVAISRAASRVAASHSATSTASEGSFAWKRRAWQSSCTAIAATRWPPYAACRLAYAHRLRASRRGFALEYYFLQLAPGREAQRCQVHLQHGA